MNIAIESKPETKPKKSKPKSKRVNVKGEQFRKKIIETALVHFSRFGFEGTSIRNLAKELDSTHSLIIYHFASKDKLWLATMDATVGEYSRSIKELLNQKDSGPAAPALQKFIEKFVRMSAERPEVHRVLTMTSTQEEKHIKWLVDEHLREHFEMVVNLIRRGQQEGSVRHCDPIRLYYHIIGSAGTMFTLHGEYRELTGRDVFAETEIYHSIAFILEMVFNHN